MRKALLFAFGILLLTSVVAQESGEYITKAYLSEDECVEGQQVASFLGKWVSGDKLIYYCVEYGSFEEGVEFVNGVQFVKNDNCPQGYDAEEILFNDIDGNTITFCVSSTEEGGEIYERVDLRFGSCLEGFEENGEFSDGGGTTFKNCIRSASVSSSGECVDSDGTLLDEGGIVVEGDTSNVVEGNVVFQGTRYNDLCDLSNKSKVKEAVCYNDIFSLTDISCPEGTECFTSGTGASCVDVAEVASRGCGSDESVYDRAFPSCEYNISIVGSKEIGESVQADVKEGEEGPVVSCVCNDDGWGCAIGTGEETSGEIATTLSDGLESEVLSYLRVHNKGMASNLENAQGSGHIGSEFQFAMLEYFYGRNGFLGAPRSVNLGKKELNEFVTQESKISKSLGEEVEGYLRGVGKDVEANIMRDSYDDESEVYILSEKRQEEVVDFLMKPRGICLFWIICGGNPNVELGERLYKEIQEQRVYK